MRFGLTTRLRIRLRRKAWGRRLIAANAVLHGRPVIYGAKIRGTIALDEPHRAVVSDNHLTFEHGSAGLTISGGWGTVICNNHLIGNQALGSTGFEIICHPPEGGYPEHGYFFRGARP